MTIRSTAAGLLLALSSTLTFAQTPPDAPSMNPPPADQPAAAQPPVAPTADQPVALPADQSPAAQSASDQAAAPAPSTQPILPGSDCDLCASVALADTIIVAKISDIDTANRTMANRDGKFGMAHLAVTQWLKGKRADAPAAFVPIPSDDVPDPNRVPANTSVVMFLASDGASVVLFKALPPDDAAIASIADLVKNPPAAQPQANLRCEIVISNPPANVGGTLLAALALTNTSDDPVRICVAGNFTNNLISDNKQQVTGSEIHFEAAKFKAAPPPDYELARQVITLPPKQLFLIPAGFAVPPNGAAITLTGHFTIPQPLADKLNLWQGTTDAPPHTIFLQPPPAPPAPTNPPDQP